MPSYRVGIFIFAAVWLRPCGVSFGDRDKPVRPAVALSGGAKDAIY
jgi:hypothetical protein